MSTNVATCNLIYHHTVTPPIVREMRGAVGGVRACEGSRVVYCWLLVAICWLLSDTVMSLVLFDV
jgi:hypothetical protein